MQRTAALKMVRCVFICEQLQLETGMNFCFAARISDLEPLATSLALLALCLSSELGPQLEQGKWCETLLDQYDQQSVHRKRTTV
jgi:hypothetical protein